MHHVLLTAQIDRETGELGLMLEGVKMIDYPMVANEGLLVAHDLLEHQQGRKKIGTIGDELLALGGVWYTRGRWSDLSRDGRGSAYSPEQNLASDVVNMGRSYILGDSRLHVKVPKRAPACDARDDIREIIRQSVNDLRSELRGEEYDRHAFARYLRFAFRLMLKGYNMARYRFERRLGGSRYYANTLFWEIAQAVDPFCKGLEYEGQRFRLSYGKGEARCEEIYDYGDY